MPDLTPAPAVPQFSGSSANYQLANHLITISITPNKPPMVVVRGNSAAEINAVLEELHAEGVYIQTASADQALKSSAPPAETVMRQLGATVAAQQPGVAPWDRPGVAGPPVPSPGQPPFGAPPGGYQAPPQQGQWGGSGAGAGVAAPAGWYRVKIPFQQKDAGDNVKNWLKGQNLYNGNVKWDGGTKTWLVSPAVVQYFQQWGPAPA